MIRTTRFPFAVAVFLVACFGAGSAGGNDSISDRGAAELAPLKQQLMGALKAGLAEGPAAAIDACRLEAPAIAARLTTEDVQLGRTSHRLRNPANTSPAWASAVLDAYLGQAGDWQSRELVLADGRAGYVEPIVTKPLCLACHGAALSKEIEAELEQHYPQDRATGFAVGDLRGVFWVELPAN